MMMIMIMKILIPILIRIPVLKLILVLQGKIHPRTAQSKHFLKLLARERLGTRRAKYPFSRCRYGFRLSWQRKSWKGLGRLRKTTLALTSIRQQVHHEL